LLNLPLQQLVPLIIIIVISLTVHEFAHSLTAIRLGDETPRREGRLTLNPLAHIDIIGFIMLVVVGFGWAKPVHIDPRALKKPQRDEILISLAGPASNVLLALVLALASAAISGPRMYGPPPAICDILDLAAFINMSLAIFNMLPIPPLDGSHLITTWLVKVNPTAAERWFRYGSAGLLVLMVVQVILHINLLPIGRLSAAIVTAFYRLLGII
jgi:Zn-dependent protease